MSPKGGIKPHKRFSIQAKRSEVLFVDYIAEHLNPNGRGGVIVPEGIIFQSGNAYKKLRKMLIENSLFAVVSLPAGVFNPYSGVKTSILFLNKNLAKKTDKILFVKVNHDGFGLGAQRRKIKENDLPLVLEIIKKYKQSIIEDKEIEFNLNEAKLANIVKKEKIAESGDYNLSGDRYKETVVYNGKWDFVELGEVCKDRGKYGSGAKKIIYDGNVRYVRITDIDDEGNLKATDIVSPSIIEEKYFLKKGDLLFARSGSVGRCYLHKLETGKYQFAGYLIRFKTDRNKVLPNFIFYLTKSEHYWNWIKNQSKTGTLTNINAKQFSSFKIPLPPLEIQERIVTELNSYQKIIDGAKQVVENYKPTFKIDPEWETVELSDVCKFVRGPFGGALKKEIFVEKGYKVYEQKHAIQNNFTIGEYYITSDKFQEMKRFEVKSGDLIVSCSGTMGKIAIVPQDIERGIINQALLKLRPDYNKINSMYIKLVLETPNIQIKYFQNTSGAAIKNVSSVKYLQTIKIPLPSIEIQQQIISKIEEEQKIIDSNKELITIFENKIKDKIADVWGEQ
jgi:type I restriction enzyme M protein